MKNVFLIFCILNLSCLFGQQTVGLFQNDSLSLNGYTLISNLNSTEVYLIDNCGDIANLWASSSFQPGPVVYLLNDGSLLRTCKLTTGKFVTGGSGGRLEKYNWNDSLIWSYNFDSPTERQHHDINVLPNGNILVLAWDLYSKSQAVSAGLDTNLYSGEVWSEKVVEIRPIGADSAAIVWEWKLWDHLIQNFDSNSNNFGIISNNSQLVDLNYVNNNGISADYFHANALDYNPILDQIIISIRNYDEFWIVDHSTTTQQASSNTGGLAGKGGDILYRWGNPETYGQGTLADKKLFGQHNPNWIPQGDRDQGKIMVFNNGLNDSNQISKVQIINPPVQANGTYFQATNSPYGPLVVDWSYDLPVFVDFVSGATRLENGNTFITSGPDGHLYELDISDSIVWKYVNPLQANNVRTTQGASPSSNSMFRAYRYSSSSSAFANKLFQNRGPIELSPTNTPCTIYPNSTTAIQQLMQPNRRNAFFVYPNPTKGLFEIKSNGFNNPSVNIFIRDVSGRLISSVIVNNTNGVFKKSFDLSEESAGVYIITIVDGKSVTNEKLILN